MVEKLGKIQSTIGHGNFAVLGFEDALRVAKNYSKIGRFTRHELDFLEMVYCRDARGYGFNGKKLISTLTQTINKRDLYKVPHAGNLFSGESHWKNIKKSKGIWETILC